MSVFSEGPNGTLQFVGDFERLYETDADPWGQSAASGERAEYYRTARDRLVARLGNYLGERVEGLEVGCGHGHLLAKLHAEIGGRWTGMDISANALRKAAEIWPEHRGLTWVRADISAMGHEVSDYAGSFNVIIWSQMLWYVAKPAGKLERAISNSLAMLEPNGLLVIHQAFLPPGEQRYARDTVDGFEGAVYAFSGGPLQLLEARYRPDAVGGLHDGLIILRKLP